MKSARLATRQISFLGVAQLSFPSLGAPRFRVTDDAGDAGKAPAQVLLDTVNQVMHVADRKDRINPAVKIDDLAVGGFAHAHIMDFVKAD